MMWMATVYTETGHCYYGPDESLSAIRKEVEGDIEAQHPDFIVTHAYIHPLPEGSSMPNYDEDPVWMWIREDAEAEADAQEEQAHHFIVDSPHR